ncbi:MAG: YaiI/YqxD family protein [Betaproteobacteria bacterium HGW-Betaproteobacteria-15]|nr:MAG: YaiI/YqxD family protein [Betaproteobacteria bacterium HGW-Betaproteobacteria-15]
MSEKLKIWVDADACPVVIKEILFRAAERTQIETILVANKLLRVPPSSWLRAMQVPGGFDVADDEIVKQIKPGDLVITADIPLAAQVIAKGGHALNPRGEFYSASNIQERLAMRNFMEELRGSGVNISGPSSFSQSDRQAFAAELDRFLTRLSKTPSSQDRP